MRLDDWLQYVKHVEKEQAALKKGPSEAEQVSPAQDTTAKPSEIAEKLAENNSGVAIAEKETGAAGNEKNGTSAKSTAPQNADLQIPALEDFLPFLKEDNQEVLAKPVAEKPKPEPAEIKPKPEPAQPVAKAEETTVESVVEISEAIVEPVAELQDSVERQESQEAAKAEIAPATEATFDLPGGNNSAGARVSVTRPVAPVAEKDDVRQKAETVREDSEALETLPRHIQAMARMQQVDEVAQNSYKRSFRESREELMARLLDPIVSLEEAARILNVCPTTVRRYTNRGLLQHYRTAGNQRRFRLSDVVVFMESLGQPARGRKAKSASEPDSDFE